ncbi:hypothetical protein F443_01954 [Phytophthora nicotianae P1569]|uniref:Uncharacterized protein n=3 Tax=Phytophthora nicotianae TaxID=4792 RepID=V9FWE7_PHYNI|nr:hypothetical protein F443_01954 [Phytophthora nicotianae P1569]
MAVCLGYYEMAYRQQASRDSRRLMITVQMCFAALRCEQQVMHVSFNLPNSNYRVHDEGVYM